MGLEIRLITSEEQYQEFKAYYDKTYNLYIMNPNIIDLLNLANNVKSEMIKWENK